jgi:hypothetical protein
LRDATSPRDLEDYQTFVAEVGYPMLGLDTFAGLSFLPPDPEAPACGRNAPRLLRPTACPNRVKNVGISMSAAGPLCPRYSP